MQLPYILCDTMVIWLISYPTQNFFYKDSPRMGSSTNAKSNNVWEGPWGQRSWKTPPEWQTKSQILFSPSPSITESLPFTITMDILGHPLFILKILCLQKAQEDSQETGRNEGRLQTLKLLSQNCQLETYGVTLKSPRLSPSLKCKSKLASLKAPTGSW